ncbi:MAG TPA: hypothetical protein PLH57_07720 [Oligoflexia bacterium]|nr:hypothetical protein [Oligoflexia bacterium]
MGFYRAAQWMVLLVFVVEVLNSTTVFVRKSSVATTHSQNTPQFYFQDNTDAPHTLDQSSTPEEVDYLSAEELATDSETSNKTLLTKRHRLPANLAPPQEFYQSIHRPPLRS